MHAVLHLQSNRTSAQQHQPLEETLRQSCLGSFLAHHHWPKLAVVAHQYELLDAHHDGDEALRLHGLRRLVDEQLSEAQVGQPRVPRPHTGHANHVGRLQDLPLRLRSQMAKPPGVGGDQVANLVLEPLQLAQLGLVRGVEVPHQRMQRQVVDGRECRFSGLGGDPNDLETRLVDLFGQLVHRHVGGRTHEHLSDILLRQVVHERGRGHRLPSPWRALNQTKRLLQHCAHSG
mmetsp:Transcript_5605/g.9207  ORF Transcript_5605/g.9207 Transcript_5605/m.9207 type:complete len:232 (+) Transcript_5605:1356-2051(+)